MQHITGVRPQRPSLPYDEIVSRTATNHVTHLLLVVSREPGNRYRVIRTRFETVPFIFSAVPPCRIGDSTRTFSRADERDERSLLSTRVAPWHDSGNRECDCDKRTVRDKRGIIPSCVGAKRDKTRTCPRDLHRDIMSDNLRHGKTRLKEMERDYSMFPLSLNNVA